MATNFAQGLVQGIVPGLGLAREFREQRKSNASRQAMEALSEFENYDPYQGVFDSTSQGVAEPGQAVTKSNRGFDGLDVEGMEKRYFKAIANFEDMDQYAKAKEAWGVAKASKITDNLDSAIAAYDRGDMEGAKKLFRGASAYISPGTTPEIEIDPKSGAIIVANYDEKGNPKGGGAFTRDQLADLRMYYTNPETWADRKQRGEEFDAVEKRLWAGFDLTKQDTMARLELAKNADQRAASESVWSNIDAEARARKAQVEMRIAETTEELALATTEAKLAAESATADETTRKAADAKVEEAKGRLFELNRFSKTMQEEILKARAGDVDVQAAMSVLVGGESGGRPGAVSSKGASGLGQIMPSNVVPWAKEVMGDQVAGMSDEEIRELYRTDPGFQYQLAESKFAQILQSNSLEDAFSIWHSGRPLKQAAADKANDIVNGKGMYTTDYVKMMMSNYQKRTGGAGGVGGGDRRVAIAEPELDALSATTEPKKPKEEEFGYATWLYNPPDEAGQVLPRSGIEAMTTTLMEEINKLNPDISTDSLAHLTNGVFSPVDQSTQLSEQPDEEGNLYLSNGVDKVLISEKGAGLVLDYRDKAAQEIIANAPDAASQPRPQVFGPQDFEGRTAPAGAGIPEAPQPTSEEVAPMETPSPMQAPGAIPGPEVANMPGYLGGAAAAGTAALNPYATPEMGAPRAIDDTAVASAPAAKQVPTPDQMSVLVQVPQLGQVVQAWIAAGAPTQGPELRAMREIVGQLPPGNQQQAIREIAAAREQAGR